MQRFSGKWTMLIRHKMQTKKGFNDKKEEIEARAIAIKEVYFSITSSVSNGSSIYILICL
jgi:hypothetical protein